MAAPAKKEETKKEEIKTVPAVAGANAPPAFMDEKYAGGKGVSTAQEDNLVPLIYILQPLSPQVDKKKPSFIEGAEPGSIWLRNAAKPIVGGDEGIIFQPCFFDKDWVEWIPRDNGGGFVARHRELPKNAERIEDERNPNRVRYVIKETGNEIIETRYHIGYVISADGPLPYVIPMSSSGHTVSRGWMMKMNSKKIGAKKAHSFTYLYRLTTVQRTNKAGTWYTWDVQDAGWVQKEEDVVRGLELHEAFFGGLKTTEAPAEPAAEEVSEAKDGDAVVM